MLEFADVEWNEGARELNNCEHLFARSIQEIEAKSKKHYIGLTWDDAGKKGGIALQADKNDFRGLLAALEGISGKKAVNTDPPGK